MALVDINRNPSRQELRTFGRLLPAFGLVVALVLWWRNGSSTIAAAVAGLAAAVTLLFFAVPRLQKPIYLGWIRATYPIGWTVSHVVMATIYLVVITPIGAGVRWFRGDPLARRFDPAARSYWHRRQTAVDVERYLRQF